MLSQRFSLPYFSHFMLLNKLLWAGGFTYNRSHFSVLWRLTSPRWRCCRFSIGLGLSFYVKTILLWPPPRGRRGKLFSHTSFYKVTIVISTWNIDAPKTLKVDSSEGYTIERWPAMRVLTCVYMVYEELSLIGGSGSLGIGTPLNSISCSEALSGQFSLLPGCYGSSIMM